MSQGHTDWKVEIQIPMGGSGPGAMPQVAGTTDLQTVFVTTGAAIGSSILPGIGTAIGAVVGLIVSFVVEAIVEAPKRDAAIAEIKTTIYQTAIAQAQVSRPVVEAKCAAYFKGENQLKVIMEDLVKSGRSTEDFVGSVLVEVAGASKSLESRLEKSFEQLITEQFPRIEEGFLKGLEKLSADLAQLDVEARKFYVETHLKNLDRLKTPSSDLDQEEAEVQVWSGLVWGDVRFNPTAGLLQNSGNFTAWDQVIKSTRKAVNP
jgi:hypothetical protein